MVEKEGNMVGGLEKSGFEELFRTFFPGLVLFARKYLPDEDTSKEIVHNVFLNLWEKRETIDTSSSLKSYLFTSVYNRHFVFLAETKMLSTCVY